MRYVFQTAQSVLVIFVLLATQTVSPINAQEDVVARTADGVLATNVSNPKEDAPKEGTPEKKTGGYDFTVQHSIECTDVKSQGSTGTCWSFATASFIESELIRREKGQHDLSEMFIVKNIYRDKARNFVLRQGKANFSQGALAAVTVGESFRRCSEIGVKNLVAGNLPFWRDRSTFGDGFQIPQR